MQVSVAAGEGLERVLTIQVPAETVETEVNNRLNSIKGSVKIDGFRPGKVPMKVVKQQYASKVLLEVSQELMQSSFRDAVTQENLQPAGDPVISAEDLVLGQEMKYTATFEVYPEVELKPVADLSIEKSVATVADSDVDEMIETLRKQRSSWTSAERTSADGDNVTIDFVGTVDGEAFEGGTAKGVPVVIGAGSMIAGFEENLQGLSVGDETSFKITFPDDYAAKDLAGKEAEFAITVHKVEAPELPKIDEEFAKLFGVTEGGVDALRKEIAANMSRELDKAMRSNLKGCVMDALIGMNPIDVPTAVVRQEAETLKQQMDAEKPSGRSVDSLLDEGKRRVQLGILLSEVAKLSALQVDPAKVSERIEEMGRDYEDPEEFSRYYANNPQLMRSVETLVMEDALVDWMVEQAQVSEKSLSFQELMNPAAS